MLRTLIFFTVLIAAISAANLRERRKAQNYILIEEIPEARAIAGTPTAVIIPAFTTHAHKVSSGTVILKDTRTVSISGFNYDGAGPDAYFLVGKGEPTATGRKIPNERGSYEVLEGYENQDIELVLPADLTWNDIDYLSVYCISFHHNFGEIRIPKNLNLPEYQG